MNNCFSFSLSVSDEGTAAQGYDDRAYHHCKGGRRQKVYPWSLSTENVHTMEVAKSLTKVPRECANCCRTKDGATFLQRAHIFEVMLFWSLHFMHCHCWTFPLPVLPSDDEVICAHSKHWVSTQACKSECLTDLVNHVECCSVSHLPCIPGVPEHTWNKKALLLGMGKREAEWSRSACIHRGANLEEGSLRTEATSDR